MRPDNMSRPHAPEFGESVAAHTPGPYTVVRNCWDVSTVVSVNGVDVAECHIHPDVTEDTQGEFEAIKDANARLIAAAPDLLAALKCATASLVAVTSLVIRAEDSKTRPSKAVASDTMFTIMLKDYDRATQEARAAIAKATGDGA